MTVSESPSATANPNRPLWIGIAGSLVLTGLIWVLGGRLDSIALLPDQGAAWYYWKLPNPTLWSRLSAWLFYALHQIFFWGIIYYGARDTGRKWANGLRRSNVIALAGNAVFILLHILQSHLWYDGLAQDVPIWSSQGSVILMLVMVLLMENQRRGLFFGKKVPISKEIVRIVRQYHGYVFAWAFVYTFWFHPTVATSGHLIGFFYMFLLMVQGSLFYSRAHLNRWWMVSLEASVLLHGALVAVMQGNSLWPMFGFGFGGLFVITQMHGLKLSRLVRGVILAIYIGLALFVYAGRGLANIHQITWIPIIEYLLVFVLAGLIGVGLWIARRVGSAPAA